LYILVTQVRAAIVQSFSAPQPLNAGELSAVTATEIANAENLGSIRYGFNHKKGYYFCNRAHTIAIMSASSEKTNIQLIIQSQIKTMIGDIVSLLPQAVKG
jgi:hypothetical protein